MQIGWIQLQEFRNYRTLSYSPSPRLNILTGANGQGKTNLLEALGLLLAGRSFRTSRLGELPRWGAETSALQGELHQTEGTRTIRRVLAKAEDGSWRVSGESCEWSRAIAFGWQDLEIINGPPSARRNFIDGFAGRLYPGHLGALGRFRQVLARRNRLLQTRAAWLDRQLQPWDEQLATVGMELVGRRRRAVAAMQSELSRVYHALADGPSGAKVEIRYQSTVGEAAEPSAFLEALVRVGREELRRGQTLVGPHRDDLAIEIDAVDARSFASRGQQRLLALSLRLAEVLPVTEGVGTPPVLLLDDALSELDPGVRARVLREIAGTEQVFLTTPEPAPVSSAACWEVKGGGITVA